MELNGLIPLFIGMPGPLELIIIFGIILLVFGGSKLPGVAKSMGQAMRAFRDETSKLKKEIEVAADEQEANAKQPAASPNDKVSTSNTTATETSAETKN
jgi:sec-independent protein translocase protein TatA